METIFYKILYKSYKVVYVGVTLRTLYERFKEHLRTKELNTKNHTIIEFNRIKHPKINSLEVFYEERRKVAELEQKYIKEELKKGSKLLNLSKGGEWGTTILNKLKKEKFLKEFGSYEGYKEYKKKKDIIKRWIKSWISHRSENKTKAWIRNWIRDRSENKTKRWIKNWISHRSENKTKAWIWNLIQHKSEGKTKRWIKSWIRNRSENKTKAYIRNWIRHRSENKTKRWISCWISNRGENKTKRWISHWISDRTRSKTKKWISHWISVKKNKNEK